MTFIKDAAFWSNKISNIERAISASKVEVSNLRDQLAACFDAESNHLVNSQIEAWESQTASFVKELEAAKVGKFA